MATPVRKRRREITGHPAPRRRGPATGTMREKTREAATHDGQELADQRTLLRRAPDRSGSRFALPARGGGARATAPAPFGPAPAPWPLDSSRTSCRRGG